MKRSTNRILVTHAGSLPRPDSLVAMREARERGEGGNDGAYEAALHTAVADIVHKQVELGVDIVDDGEMSKASFLTYINERLGGFGASSGWSMNLWGPSREVRDFPEYYDWFGKVMPSPVIKAKHLDCIAPIAYTGQKQVQTDIANLKAALRGSNATEAFIPSISPTDVEWWQKNKYYKTGEEYLFAIADAMAEEYKAIVDAGFLLQIDDPFLITYYIFRPDQSVQECRKWAAVRVEALNHALRNIPRDRIRFHTCYSINMGPRVHDMELKDIVDVLLRIKAGAFSFEAANPRHDHEWKVWENVKMPKDTILIPGVITHSSVLVEHPELVAERLKKYASVVGPENVIAGGDCGFATFAGSVEIHPSIVWAKFKAMSEGAAIASKELYRKSARRAAKPARGAAAGRRAAAKRRGGAAKKSAKRPARAAKTKARRRRA